MAWSVDNIWLFVKFLIRKNQGGGVSPNDLFYSWNAEQRSYMGDLLGHWQSRSNGKTGLNTGLIENETTMQKLSPFVKKSNLSIASGTAKKPDDFIYRLAMRINGFDCFKINHNQIASISASAIDAPSISGNSYYFVEYGDGFYFLPNSVTASEMDYISNPTDIVWAFTYGANNRPIYSASGLTKVPVIFGGAGYTTPTIAFSAPAAGGVQATGTLTVVGGIITNVVMTNIGEGYAGLTPTFTITGASTTPANLGNPVVSVQPMWDDLSVIEITKRSLKSLGVSFKDGDFASFGNSNINTGD